MKQSLKLNLGCGTNPLTGYWNVDMHCREEADEIRDIRLGLTQKDASQEKVTFFHCLEHIERKHHIGLFLEILRVLKPGGEVVVSFPDFEECSKLFLSNHRGKADFWEKTIFGRQAHPGDYHYCAITIYYLRDLLVSLGFEDLRFAEEPQETYNKVVRATRPKIVRDRSEVLREEIYARA